MRDYIRLLWRCVTLQACPTTHNVRFWSHVCPAEGVRTQWQTAQLTIMRVCGCDCDWQANRNYYITNAPLMETLNLKSSLKSASLILTLHTHPETLSNSTYNGLHFRLHIAACC